jgi:hypothetical protein
VGLQPSENKALSLGIIGTSAPTLAEITIRKSQTIVLWECFFDDRFRNHPLPEDANMHQLWRAFEHYLVQKFPKAETSATPFNDPIAESIVEYQSFLKSLGYSPLAEAAYGKKVR